MSGPGRAELLAALQAAEHRAAALRADLTQADAEVAALRRQLRKCVASDVAGRKGDKAACEADKDGVGAADKGDEGVDKVDKGKDGVSVVRESTKPDPRPDVEAPPAKVKWAAVPRVKRARTCEWPPEWQKIAFVRGGNVPQGACRGCWWLFQGWDGYRQHDAPAPAGACVLRT